MLASKAIGDGAYPNKSWSIATQATCALPDWHTLLTFSHLPILPPPMGTITTPSHGPRFQSPPKPIYLPPSAYITMPTMPDTPSPSYLTSTAPLTLLPMPPGIEDCAACIALASLSPGILKYDPVSSTTSFESQDVRFLITVGL
ncbi:hypothetical protein AZE42_12677, partial [Rhizopogon vesiculosus]